MAFRRKRAQAALEYLITYGWALVMVATIVTMLIFVTGGGINTNTCTTFLTMLCKGVGADGDTLVLVLQNITGQKISITPFIDIKFDDKAGYAIVTYQGKEYKFEEVTINSGDQFTISAKGMAQAETISITYIERSTGFTRTVTSKISTDALDTLEISNDGIDNDGDGLVDCQDPSVSNCFYVNSAETISLLTVSPGVPSTIVMGPLKGHEGGILSGTWKASAVSVSIFVESLVPGSKGTIMVNDAPYFAVGEIIDLKPGWNTIDLTASLLVPFQGSNVFDIQLWGPSASSYTINNGANAPKISITVNKSP